MCVLFPCCLTLSASPLTPIDILDYVPEHWQPFRGLLLSEPLTCLTGSALPFLVFSALALIPTFSFLPYAGDAGSGLVHAGPSSSCLSPPHMAPHS